MMLTLGLFVFQLQTLPYQSLQHSLDYRWPSNSRIGQRPAYQFLGVGEEKIMLSGVLLPEITGGVLSLLALKIMAEQGKAWPLRYSAAMARFMVCMRSPVSLKPTVCFLMMVARAVSSSA